MIKKEPTKRGKIARWKDTIESELRVIPMLGNIRICDTEIVEHGRARENGPPTSTRARCSNNSSVIITPSNPKSKTKPRQK